MHTSELIDELWGERVPRSALSTLQTYIYKLRKVLGGDRGDVGTETLRTKPYGYVLAIPRESLDLHLFERLVSEGSAALENDDASAASEYLGRALSLWRGRALTDITTGEPLSAHLTRLEESRLRAVELSCEAELRLGRHNQLISELKTLTAQHPFHEGFHTRLMTALYRAGRRTEALGVYQRLRRVLCEDLGLEPSPVVDRTHQALLSSDPALDLGAPPVTVGGGLRALGSPAQLPPDIGDFIGREAQLERAEQWLTAGDTQTAVPVLSITGLPGIGKTAFATRLAHLLAADFPDGKFYARLREPDGRAVSSKTVLTGFLRSAGLSAAELPDDSDQLEKIFRTWSTGRSILVVLDDAVSVRQVLPLLPSYARCAVIVTSRGRLHAFPGARTLALPVLSPREGEQLLAGLIGRDRFEADRAASTTLVRLCHGLPAALRCAGASIVARSWSTTTYVRRLTDGRNRLDELRMGDEDIRARFERAYRDLDHDERRVFAAIGRLRRAEVTASQVAALTGGYREAAEFTLIRLVDRDLLQTVPTPGKPQYTMHELLRLFAEEIYERDGALLALPSSGGGSATERTRRGHYEGMLGHTVEPSRLDSDGVDEPVPPQVTTYRPVLLQMASD